MNYDGTNYRQELNTRNALFSIESYYNLIEKWSNLTFYDVNLNKTSLNISKIYYSGIYRFTTAAEKLLNENEGTKTYTMVVFDIDRFNDISKLYGPAFAADLINHIDTTLNSYINQPNLYCRINDDNFAIFLENNKAIDVALLVIQLTEEISSFMPDLKHRLSFGICKANQPDQNIPSLCQRAFYAKSTIKGQNQHFLANYNELEFNKKAVLG